MNHIKFYTLKGNNKEFSKIIQQRQYRRKKLVKDLGYTVESLFYKSVEVGKINKLIEVLNLTNDEIKKVIKLAKPLDYINLAINNTLYSFLGKVYVIKEKRIEFIKKIRERILEDEIFYNCFDKAYIKLDLRDFEENVIKCSPRVYQQLEKINVFLSREYERLNKLYRIYFNPEFFMEINKNVAVIKHKFEDQDELIEILR